MLSRDSLRMLAVAGVLLAAAPRVAAAGQADPASRPAEDLILAQGEGTVRTAADRAFVTLTTETRARTPKEAQAANGKAMTSVRAALTAAGIGEAQVRTTGVHLDPEFDWKDGKQTLRGYVARNSVEVTLDELARVGEVIDTAVNAGATSAGDVRFDLKDRRAVEQKALALAVQDARARLEAMASAAGRSLDRITRVDDQGGRFAPPPRPMYMRAGAAEA
ncbi:MAG: SIMPL domain-containing protein, partial [Vicinamibacteraceae bacterium]|nr:SIMPL domain-containing protein [Vicinamibacteraceae bacterium]